MTNILNTTNNKYPFDEGVEARALGLSIHDNPYKSPNISKTDDVKSSAWITGFNRGE